MNNISDSLLEEVLLKGTYLPESDLKVAEKEAKNTKQTLGSYLLSRGLITRELIGQAIAEYFRISFTKLNLSSIAAEFLQIVPEGVAKKHRLVVFGKEGETLMVATDNPQISDDEVVKRIFVKNEVKYYFVFSEDLDSVFNKTKETVEVRFSKILASNKEVAPTIVEEILEDAILYQASDIHFEPMDTIVRVRFRIDGQLKEVATLPKESYQNIVRVIKNRANLAVDEKMKAQDGAIRLTKNGTPVDLRISIIPIINGEKVVIRLLSEYVKTISIASLGMSGPDEALLTKIAANPFGMILTVGPTGSGKTTTLYSLIKTLNKPEINITTIEDPVEYKIDGINHIQVNEKTDLTFARGLRSIVRQDPNIIFVGEIRDKETAEIAANAALTGHLVLSTFHANDAATAFPRLLDMGIEPFLLSSTLEMVIGQRLVRRICDSCRFSEDVSMSDLKRKFELAPKFFSDKTITLYRGKGCNLCNGTGYKGRIAIYELVFSTPELQNLLLKSPSRAEVWRLAKAQGAHSMFEDGLAKIKSGYTTLEELLRVAQPTPEDVYKK